MLRRLAVSSSDGFCCAGGEAAVHEDDLAGDVG